MSAARRGSFFAKIFETLQCGRVVGWLSGKLHPAIARVGRVSDVKGAVNVMDGQLSRARTTLIGVADINCLETEYRYSIYVEHWFKRIKNFSSLALEHKIATRFDKASFSGTPADKRRFGGLRRAKLAVSHLFIHP